MSAGIATSDGRLFEAGNPSTTYHYGHFLQAVGCLFVAHHRGLKKKPFRAKACPGCTSEQQYQQQRLRGKRNNLTGKLPPLPPGDWFDEFWLTFPDRLRATTYSTSNVIRTYPLRVDMPTQEKSSIDYEFRFILPSVYQLHVRIPAVALHVALRESMLRPSPSITTQIGM